MLYESLSDRSVSLAIKEARMILNNKPDLNYREEQANLRKYLAWINLLYFISVRFCPDKYV